MAKNHDRVKIGVSVLIGLILLGLFTYTVYFFWFQARHEINEFIATDTTRLTEILQRVDNQCEIMSFDQEKSYINFLNVGCFEGSEVGPMNLAYPKKWEGPYLKDNPTLQGFYYYVLKNKNGYYVVPGDGVKLSNGKVLGKDIVISSVTNIEELLKNEPGLWFNTTPLITKLTLKRAMKSHLLRRALVQTVS
jgi:hypothetical protein